MKSSNNLNLENISDLSVSEDGCKLTWFYKERKIEKVFRLKIRAYTILNDKSGIIVVGNYKEFGQNNAMILGKDSSIRTSLKMPEIYKNKICFYDVYYSLGILKIIIEDMGIEFMCDLNSDNGEIFNCHETR